MPSIYGFFNEHIDNNASQQNTAYNSHFYVVWYPVNEADGIVQYYHYSCTDDRSENAALTTKETASAENRGSNRIQLVEVSEVYWLGRAIVEDVQHATYAGECAADYVGDYQDTIGVDSAVARRWFASTCGQQMSAVDSVSKQDYPEYCQA